jgi:hypothetical protein
VIEEGLRMNNNDGKSALLRKFLANGWNCNTGSCPRQIAIEE